MTPRAEGRTRTCTAADARARLEIARGFLVSAESEAHADPPGFPNSIVSNCINAGIAACDAACCKAIGRHAHGEGHDQALPLVEQVEPGGREAARRLGRLLGLKNDANYGFHALSGAHARTALASAREVVAFAERIVQR